MKVFIHAHGYAARVLGDLEDMEKDSQKLAKKAVDAIASSLWISVEEGLPEEPKEDAIILLRGAARQHETYNYYLDEKTWHGYYIMDHNEFLLYLKGSSFTHYQPIIGPTL